MAGVKITESLRLEKTLQTEPSHQRSAPGPAARCVLRAASASLQDPQGQQFCCCPGQRAPVYVKQFFLIPDLNLPLHNLRPFSANCG